MKTVDEYLHSKENNATFNFTLMGACVQAVATLAAGFPNPATMRAPSEKEIARRANRLYEELFKGNENE